MPKENFNGYVKYDPNNHINIASSTHVDFNAYRNEDAWLYDDKGIDHFGDFTHHIDVKFVSSFDLNTVCPFWGLTNIVNDYLDILLANEESIWLYLRKTGTGNYVIKMCESCDGSLYQTPDQAISLGTWYYLKIIKSGTSLKCKGYSDPGRTTLLWTLPLTLHADHSFRYVFPCNTYNSGDNKKGDLDIENLDLAPTVAKRLILRVLDTFGIALTDISKREKVIII